MKNTFRNYFFSLSFLLASLAPAQATVVRMDIALGNQPSSPVYVELFDTQAPVTTSNFLNYIENSSGDRRYDGTFFHRSIPGFIVQGGGFAYDPALGAFNFLTAPHIPVDAPIVNEFSSARSNLRGTITMAKQAGNPDSATSEWFFNLVDNSANLDFQNGGFTVFGQVLGSGMTTIDAIANLPVENLGGAFSDLPLYNHTVSTPVLTQNLVTVTMEDSPFAAPLFASPAPLDFGPAVVGTGAIQRVVTLVNVGNTNLTFGNLANLDALAAPFTIVSDNCSTLPIAPFSSCTLTLEFTPTSAGLAQDTFDIPSDSASQPTVSFPVSGTGVPSQANIVIPDPALIDVGDTQSGIPTTKPVIITNDGAEDLFISAVTITGPDASAFTVTNNCQQVTVADGICAEQITFTPTSIGSKTATLEIASNDPDTPLLSLPISATSSTDNDGISDQIEAAGPNNGDANRDGVPDLQQQNVVSLPDIKGNYVTLETDPGLLFGKVKSGVSPSPDNTPTADSSGVLDFESGFFSFAITNLPFGGATTVTITLPEGATPSSYFKFGWLPGESPFLLPAHWYQFKYDSVSGTGAEIRGNQVILHLVDGGLGDNDLTRDGRIFDPGGPATLTTFSSSSGGGGCTPVPEKNPGKPAVGLLLILAGLRLIRKRPVQNG